MTVAVTVYYTSKSEVTVRHAVEACDAAFEDVEVAVALVRPPGSSNKDNSHKRKARNLRIAMISIGAILGAALVAWSCVRGRESLVRARRLARTRFRAPAVDDAELPAPAAAKPELALDRRGARLPAHALAVDGGQ